jgi:hypothetical protein
MICICYVFAASQRLPGGVQQQILEPVHKTLDHMRCHAKRYPHQSFISVYEVKFRAARGQGAKQGTETAEVACWRVAGLSLTQPDSSWSTSIRFD